MRLRPVCRAFTTLSTSLGHMAVGLHHALFQALSREQGSVLLIALLRALAALQTAAPYPRLPDGLQISALQVRHTPHGEWHQQLAQALYEWLPAGQQ